MLVVVVYIKSLVWKTPGPCWERFWRPAALGLERLALAFRVELMLGERDL